MYKVESSVGTTRDTETLSTKKIKKTPFLKVALMAGSAVIVILVIVMATALSPGGDVLSIRKQKKQNDTGDKQNSKVDFLKPNEVSMYGNVSIYSLAARLRDHPVKATLIFAGILSVIATAIILVVALSGTNETIMEPIEIVAPVNNDTDIVPPNEDEVSWWQQNMWYLYGSGVVLFIIGAVALSILIVQKHKISRSLSKVSTVDLEGDKGIDLQDLFKGKWRVLNENQLDDDEVDGVEEKERLFLYIRNAIINNVRQLNALAYRKKPSDKLGLFGIIKFTPPEDDPSLDNDSKNYPEVKFNDIQDLYIGIVRLPEALSGDLILTTRQTHQFCIDGSLSFFQAFRIEEYLNYRVKNEDLALLYRDIDKVASGFSTKTERDPEELAAE